MPVQSVADALRLASSIDVRMRGVSGVQSDFAVRGANFGQMLVLVDGVRLNDAQSGHHNGDIPVPLDAVERIEVLYGPGSSLFGADAFGGTVNVITRRAVETAGAGCRGRHASARPPCAVRSDSRAAVFAKRWPRPSIDRPDSCTTATTRRRSCDRTPRLDPTRACRFRTCGKSSVRTTSTAAMRHRVSGPIRPWSRPIIVFERQPVGARAPSRHTDRMVTGSSSTSCSRSSQTTGIARMRCWRRSAARGGSARSAR